MGFTSIQVLQDYELGGLTFEGGIINDHFARVPSRPEVLLRTQAKSEGRLHF